MSRKNEGKSKRREERERLVREEQKRTRNKRIAAVAICLAVLIVIGILAHNAPTDFDACTGMGAEAQHVHSWVFIHLGNATDFTTKFIRLPTSMGIDGSSCMYPIHIHETPGARQEYYTMLHVESSFTPQQHAYNLHDLFTVWGRWLYDQNLHTQSPSPDQPIAFGPNRVANYTGPLEVRVSADSDPLTANYTLVGTDYAFQDQMFVHIWVHDPYVNTGSAY